MLGEEKDVDVVTPDWREVLMPDLDLHVRVRPDLVHYGRVLSMAYEVRDLIGYRADGEDEIPLYRKVGATSSMDDTIVVEEAEMLVRGTIKWDGCSDNHFLEYVHQCERKGLVRFGTVFDRLFDMAIEMMPGHREYLV